MLLQTDWDRNSACSSFSMKTAEKKILTKRMFNAIMSQYQLRVAFETASHVLN